MQRLSALVLLLLAAGISDAGAQALQRFGTGGTYGTTSNSPYGGTGGVGGRSFTAPSTAAATDTGSNSNSDYDRVMKAATPSTDLNNQDVTDPSSDPNVDASSNATPAFPTTPSTNTALPGAGTGFAASSGFVPNGGTAANAAPGMPGLGVYNRSPYAGGLTSGNASTNPAPGPVTPTYTGSNTNPQ